MNRLTLPAVLRFVYPYWVISRVLALVLGSLAFLVLHQSIRYLLHLPILTKQELGYVDRTN